MNYNHECICSYNIRNVAVKDILTGAEIVNVGVVKRVDEYANGFIIQLQNRQVMFYEKYKMLFIKI